MRIELYDSEGNKYAFSFEGEITREKAIRFLDLLELLGGAPTTERHEADQAFSDGRASKYERVKTIVKKHFPLAWFSSVEIQSVYEQEFKEPITLSTVATYLSRMAAQGFLLRGGVANKLRYKVAYTAKQVITQQKMP